MHLKDKHWRRLWGKIAAPKVPEWPSYGNFWQGHLKPAFSKKVQRGDLRKFFKIAQKDAIAEKAQKAVWRKWHYPLISTNLKCKNCKTFSRKQRLQKCPKGQVMAISAGSPKTRIL